MSPQKFADIVNRFLNTLHGTDVLAAKLAFTQA